MPENHDAARPRADASAATLSTGRWKLEDAKARFSEVVRKARSEGPQRVSVRGRDAVVVIAADEFDGLQPRVAPALPFVAFMESLWSDGLDLTRDPDVGRDVQL